MAERKIQLFEHSDAAAPEQSSELTQEVKAELQALDSLNDDVLWGISSKPDECS